MKKLLAVLLSLCLVVGMLPMMAFADAEDSVMYNDGNTTEEKPISEIMPSEGELLAKAKNNTKNIYYKYVADALRYADYGDTVELLVTTAIKSNTVKEGVTLKAEDGIVLTIADGEALTVYGIIDCKIEGTVDYKEGSTKPADDENTPPEEEMPPVEEEPDPDPVYYTVTFNVYPYWATVTVTDDNGTNVTVNNNKVAVEEGKVYNYTVSAPGFKDERGSFTASKNDTITEKLELIADLLVWPYSHGSVMTEQLGRGWVAVYTEPDSGYYLDDLTIYRVGYGAIDYGKWDNGVYYFRMRAGQQYIIDADFAAAPSEYRVYVDSSILHGDVSVDTVYAEEGEWVYITVDPDVGYRLYNLTVTRPSGNTVKVEHVRDNVYRFSMPGVRVTVDAEFIRTVTPFTDVRLADWFYEYVSFAYRYGLMEGINSYQFAPDATATRAMVVQILYRMSGEPAVSYGSGFTDVASNAWYADAIAWAARNNIVNGTSAATFDPNAPVTREQFATMLYRYARYRGFNTSLTANILSYYDVNQVSEYAFEALQWACAEGIVNGTSTGYLTPQGNATRAQLAAMLMRFCTEYFDL